MTAVKTKKGLGDDATQIKSAQAEEPVETTVYDPGATMHDEGLYHHDSIAPKVDGLDGVTEAHVEFFRQHGFLAVEHAFTADEVEAGLAGLIHLIMGGNPEFKGIMFEAKAREVLSTLGPEARQDAVRKLMAFVDYDDRLKLFSHHPSLTRVIESILEDRSVLFQDMALLKPPRVGREKPWHQDHAYFNYPIGTRIVGVWIALDEATLENGCMRLLDGHHKEGAIVHFKRRDWQICDSGMQEKTGIVAAPLKPGGLLLFDGLLPHGTPHNNSPLRRRALQFHYRNQSAHSFSEEERLAIFGGEGRGAQC